MWWSPGEQAIAFQVKINALKKMLQVENAIAAPFQNLDLVVEPFHEATAGSVDKVVGDLFPPTLQGLQEFSEAGQPAFLDPADPGPQFPLRLRFREALFKDGGQLLAQV